MLVNSLLSLRKLTLRCMECLLFSFLIGDALRVVTRFRRVFSLSFCWPIGGGGGGRSIRPILRLMLRRGATGALLASVLFVAACAGGGGGGGGGSNGGPAPAERGGLFSHAAYDFILANTTRLDASATDRVLGVIFLEEPAVQARIGLESEITGVAYTLTGLEQSFFSITPRRAADLTGGVRVLFGSPNFPNTPLTLDYVVNTLGVDRMTVTATITYVDAQGSEQELTVAVPVSVRAVVAVPDDVNAFLVFEGMRRAQRVVNRTAGGQASIVQQQLRFTADGAVAENAGVRAGVDGLNGALTRLGIRLRRPAGFTRMPTVYFRLANASGPALTDCGRVFYLDNRERNIRTRGALNYEAQAAYGCKLEASLRGLNYTEVVARPSGAALAGIDNVSGAVASGAGNVTACAAGDLAVVRAGGCAYRAAFAIAVRDVNEPVHLNVTLGNRSVYEGDVGGLTDAPAVGAVPRRDVLLARVRYHEQDHDEANERLRVAAPVLAAMTPQAAPDLFIVRPHGADEVGLYLNVSAVSGLDYETLAVNATGQKSYRLLLRATDNSTEGLVTDAAVHVAVQDVVYAPTNFTYRNASGAAVTEQLLLPGLAQLVAHGGPVLGTLRALDPETRQTSVVEYAYVGVSGLVPADARRQAAINGSFALTGARANGAVVADQVSLVGLGLRAGDRFTLNLTAVHGAAVHPLPARAYARLGVAMRVAYQPDMEGYGGQPPVRFTAGVLNGTVSEGRPGAVVLLEGGDLRAHVVGSTARHFDLLDQADLNALLTHASGLDRRVRAAIERALPDLDRVDAAVFKLNATTGRLALQPNQAAHFTTKASYTLLVRVSNTTATDYARSDYALLTVAVEDTNLPPQLVTLRATAARLAQADQAAARLTVMVPEDTAAGTELARLHVTDDNPLLGLTWGIAPAGIAARMVQVVPVAAPVLDARTNNYTGIYALQTTTALDYEPLPQGRLALTLFLTDGGQYGLDPHRRVYALGDGHHNMTVAVGGNVTDVNEALALRVASRAAVPEDAPVGTRIVTVDVVDPDEDVGTAGKLIPQLRSVPASLAPALALANFASISANRSRWDLVVANASLLENAGDGRTFDVTILVTENRSTAPTRAAARLALTVTDVVHPFVLPDLSGLMLNLSEQQALDASSGLVLRENLFSLSADVQKDYDEFWFGNFRAVDVQARAGAIRYVDAIENARSLQREEQFNLFQLRTRGDTVDLLLGETRLIEDKLIGNRIELMVALVDPSGAVAPATLPVPVAIVASDASDDLVRFADAEASFGVKVPSAYAFRYTQSDYGPVLSASVCGGADRSVNITIDERCYATVRLADGRDYVQRDRRAQRYFGSADAALRNGTGAEIGLVFTDAEVNVSSLGIYALNAKGHLRVADAEFKRYFELVVDQRYVADGAGPRPALVVRPRALTVLNRTTGQPLANQSYLALDTLPLNNADPRRSLQFFVLAMEDGGDANNATQRAIAQLNFEVVAANLNTPVAAELVLGRHRLTPGTPLLLVENGVDRDLDAAVNTPMPLLNFSIRNPDGFARNQSATAVVDVVATRAGALGNGSFDLEQGTASGRDLVRLGAAADARHRLNITLRSNQTVRTVLPFQLARNTRGRALVRLHLVERDAEGVEVANRVVYYELRVRAGDGPRQMLAPLKINDVSGPIGENGLDALTAQGTGLHLNLTLTVPQAEAPHNLTIHQVNVTGQSAVLRVAAQGIQRPDPATTVFRQALVHTPHHYGPTRFAITTQVREPRGFGDQLSAPYFVPPVGREIAVNPENDPLTVVCDADNALDNCGYRPARYLLSALNPARVGSALVPSGTEEVVRVLFADDDLLAGEMPPMTVTNFVDADPADALSLDGNNFAVNADDIVIPRAGDTNRFNVTFPVRFRLTQAEFASLNASGAAETLAFRFTLADPGSSGTVDADGSIELLPDRDGDGLTDADDSCPLIANADRQGDDRDTDGIGDPCEARAVTDLRAVADDLDAVNLSLEESGRECAACVALNITYGLASRPVQSDRHWTLLRHK